MSFDQSGEYTFIWEIKNYSCCYQEVDEILSSPVFVLEELYGSEWQIEICPQGYAGDKYFAFFLVLTNAYEGFESMGIDFRIEILDDKNCAIEFIDFIRVAFDLNEYYLSGSQEFLKVELLQEKLSSWLQDSLTLKCRIKSDELKATKFYGSKAWTTIGVDESSFVWYVILPTFFKHSENINFSIISKYHFNVSLSYHLEHVEITIHLKNNDKPVKVTFEFTAFDEIGCKLHIKRASFLFDTSDTVKFPEFITKEHLEACKTDKNRYKLTLKCNAYISNNSMSSCQKFSFTSSSVNSILDHFPTTVLHDDFQNIFITKKDADVTIKTGKDEVLAHKFVLRVRSPVLDAMFDQEMLESQTNVVKITDIDSDTLKIFLKFLYTGTVEVMNLDIAKKLIYAADKYQVLSLVEECATFLKSALSVENVCEIISIANMVSCENLKSSALNFIRVNTSQVLQTSDWSNWIERNIKLATYIFSKLSIDLIQESQ